MTWLERFAQLWRLRLAAIPPEELDRAAAIQSLAVYCAPPGCRERNTATREDRDQGMRRDSGG